MNRTKGIKLAAALALWAALAHSAAPPGAAPAAEDVLARFEGGQISVSDLEAAIANKDPSTRRRLATNAERMNFLRELENYDLLVLEAERRGYAKHPAVIDAKRRVAIDAMLAAELSVDPASIPAADVARELALRSALADKPAAKPRLSAVEGALREELAQQRFAQARNEFAERLYEKYRPEVRAELVDAVTPSAVPRDQPDGFPAAPPDPRAAPRLIESDGI